MKKEKTYTNPFVTSRGVFLTQKILLVSLICSLQSCSDPEKEIIGTWKLDSIYTYFNGYGYMQHEVDSYPNYEFQSNGKVKMTLQAEQRFFNYRIDGDTLEIENHASKPARFYLEKLNSQHLHLREPKAPLFEKKNQVRYNVRFLSRVVR